MSVSRFFLSLFPLFSIFLFFSIICYFSLSLYLSLFPLLVLFLTTLFLSVFLFVTHSAAFSLFFRLSFASFFLLWTLPHSLQHFIPAFLFSSLVLSLFLSCSLNLHLVVQLRPCSEMDTKGFCAKRFKRSFHMWINKYKNLSEVEKEKKIYLYVSQFLNIYIWNYFTKFSDANAWPFAKSKARDLYLIFITTFFLFFFLFLGNLEI